jgi:uncharacterized protein (DUF1697 family)
MSTYVALIRGINLGPRNKIAMAELRDLLESRGLANVRTLISSGNVVFTSRRRNTSRLERQIERAINKRFRLDIRVLIRTADEFAAVVRENSLPESAAGGRRLFALFADRNPAQDRLDSIDRTAFGPEQFRVGDRVIYALVKQGVRGSRLLGALSDKRVGVALTNRNWNTVMRLHELVGTRVRG